MAEGVDAHDLQEEAQGHGRQTESVVADSAHSDEPRDHNRREGEPGELAVDAFKGTEPEEADKEEADTAEHPDP